MYESNIGDLTNRLFTANKSKRLDKWGKDNPASLFLRFEPCWSGAGSEKDPSAAGEGAFVCLEEHLTGRNFHPDNPQKAFMDHVIDWKLIHRDEADMDRLFEASAFGHSAEEIRFEEEKVNLFAICRK